MLTDATLKINAVAENCGFSNPYHFCRIFKQKTGLTPNAYLNRLRIEKAKKLLAKTNENMNIKQIADSCGFNDQYYFSRIFKRSEGVSPAHWKRQKTNG